MKNKRLYLLVIFFSLLTFLFSSKVLAIPDPTAADTNSWALTSPINPSSQVKFKPSITIPNSEFKVGGINLVSGDLLGTYIASLYRYGAILAIIVAMFMLVLAGWKWLMAAGSSERINSAKDTISGALVGLALLFGGYLLMSQISTRLVEFGTLNITPPTLVQSVCQTYDNEEDCVADKLCRWEASADGTSGLCILYSGQICPADSQVIPITIRTDNLTVTASEPKLMPEAEAALYRAAKSLQVFEAITVTSAYRSWALQQTLYDCYINKVGSICPNGCRTCNEAAKPSCNAPHQTGLAVDVCYKGYGTDTCTNEIMDSDYNCLDSIVAPCTPAIQGAERRLHDIMVGAGFTPLESEWWHFKL